MLNVQYNIAALQAKANFQLEKRNAQYKRRYNAKSTRQASVRTEPIDVNRPFAIYCQGQHRGLNGKNPDITSDIRERLEPSRSSKSNRTPSCTTKKKNQV